MTREVLAVLLALLSLGASVASVWLIVELRVDEQYAKGSGEPLRISQAAIAVRGVVFRLGRCLVYFAVALTAFWNVDLGDTAKLVLTLAFFVALATDCATAFVDVVDRINSIRLARGGTTS